MEQFGRGSDHMCNIQMTTFVVVKGLLQLSSAQLLFHLNIGYGYDDDDGDDANDPAYLSSPEDIILLFDFPEYCCYQQQ